MRKILYILLLLTAVATRVDGQTFRRTASGVLLVDTGAAVRAMSPFGGGSQEAAAGYAAAVNRYQREFPQTQVYCMVIPTAVAYYCPDSASAYSRPEQPAIDLIYNELDSNVKPIDAYYALALHVAEPIYSRTDHHWSPLGAYYAAREFARVAGVPFRDLSHYDTLVVHDYVGSMSRYSKSSAVRNAPEDFVYYVPRGVEYSTISTSYTPTRDRLGVARVGATGPAPYFRSYPDGSGAAYCTFMGGDYNTTYITTSTHNNRRLLILKDSFGNPLPAYLMGSFEEIDVVDCRYFTLDMREFVEQHAITDILFANNINHAFTERTAASYERYIGQHYAEPQVRKATASHRRYAKRRSARRRR